MKRIPGASEANLARSRNHSGSGLLCGSGDTTVANLPDDFPPTLVVVIDTEEEFNWSAPFSPSNNDVTAIQEQGRAQEVYNKYGVRPLYAVDYPVAVNQDACRVLGGFLRDGLCDIGTHLQPWVNPPFEEEISNFNSYPGNLPEELEVRKLEALTGAIEESFGIRPICYKAGRYGVGPATTKILEKLGYCIDLSVVPHSDFGADGGPDFRHCADRPYWFGGRGDLLEIPLSRGFVGLAAKYGRQLFPIIDSHLGRQLHFGGLVARARVLERITLTPEGVDQSAHRRLTKSLLASGHRIFSLTYHSSSLGIGGSPYVQDEQQRRQFIIAIDAYLRFFRDEVGGTFSTPHQLYETLVAIRHKHIQPDAATAG